MLIDIWNSIVESAMWSLVALFMYLGSANTTRSHCVQSIDRLTCTKIIVNDSTGPCTPAGHFLIDNCACLIFTYTGFYQTETFFLVSKSFYWRSFLLVYFAKGIRRLFQKWMNRVWRPNLNHGCTMDVKDKIVASKKNLRRPLHTGKLHYYHIHEILITYYNMKFYFAQIHLKMYVWRLERRFS